MTFRAAIASRNAKYYKTECSDIINYNNSNNNYALITAYHFHKTCCGQTDRLTDIATCRAVIAAKIAKYDYRMI